MRLGLAVVCAAACGRANFDTIDDAGSRTIPPPFTAGTRLRPYVTEAAGGARVRSGWRDTLLGIDCRFEAPIDNPGQGHCLPAVAVTTPLMRDASCTQPLGLDTPPSSLAQCANPAKYTRSDDLVYPIISPYGGTVYAEGPTGCSAISSFGAGSVVVDVGPPAPATEFASWREEIVPYGRLSYIVSRAEDGASQVSTVFFDTLLGQRCQFTQLEPGRAWCVPEGEGQYTVLYADTACTERVAAPDAPVTRVMLYERQLCDEGARYFELGEPFAGQLYYRGSSGCQQSTGTFANPRRLGAQLSLDVLASATLEHEPFAGRIELVRWRMSDGLVTYGTMWDTTTGDDCQPNVDPATDRFVCAPTAPAFSSLFSDSGCTVRLGPVAPSCRNRWVAQFTQPQDSITSGCDGPRFDFYGFDSELPAGTYYESRDGQCAVAPTAGLSLRMPSGAKVDATTLEPLTRGLD